MTDLQNLNILLTGSTGGIGGAILNKLLENKAKVIATGTNEKKLDIIKKKFTDVIVKKFDITNHETIQDFIEECNEIFQKKIDVLINNAGITNDNLAIRMKDEEWNKVINLNLTSSFLLTKNTIKKC